MDGFLRSTDATYQHAEAPQGGTRFVRQMATYGSVRPSPTFVSESRMRRPFNKDSGVGMSALPATWNDPQGFAKEGTLVVPQPPAEISTEYVEMLKNDKLMLPSERRAEARAIVEGEKQWREARANLFQYKKRVRSLEMKYPDGVEGIDGPMYPETRIYAERRAQLQLQGARSQAHGEGRFEHLAQQNAADDATALRNYGADPQMKRCEDICAQRKCIDPEMHPVRFQDTHSRIFPQYTPVWDPQRAASLRTHDVRERRHNIVNGASNAVTYEVANNWGLPAPAQPAEGE
jgi:hypothetical protein